MDLIYPSDPQNPDLPFDLAQPCLLFFLRVICIEISEPLVDIIWGGYETILMRPFDFLHKNPRQK